MGWAYSGLVGGSVLCDEIGVCVVAGYMHAIERHARFIFNDVNGCTNDLSRLDCIGYNRVRKHWQQLVLGLEHDMKNRMSVRPQCH